MEYTLDSFVVTSKLINSEKLRKLVFYSMRFACHHKIISQDDHSFCKRFIFVFVFHKMNSLHLLNKILSLLDLHFTIISFKYK